MVLACDVGTTTVKAGIIDIRGKLVSLARERIPGVQAAGFTVRNWTHALKKALGRLAFSPVSGLRAVAVSGNGPSLVLLDKNGKPLAPVLLWYETNEAGARNREPPGLLSYFLPRAVRLARNRPRLYEKTRLFIPCPEYICYLLTGRAATALPHEEYSDYFWSPEEIRRCALDNDKFPPFIPFTAAVGMVTAAASREFGLPQGIPVFSGGPDFLMALLGTAVVVPGRTQDRAGSSEGINHCVRERVTHPGLRTLPGLLKHTYNISGVVPRSGSLLEQAAAQLYPRSVSFTRALGEALQSRAGAGGLFFLPGTGPRQGAVGGREHIKGSFIETQEEHGPQTRLRAVIEGLCLRLRVILNTMETCGLEISKISISGGQALNPALVQLKADIIGVGIKVPAVTDAELTGNACVALSALGEYAAPEQAAQQLVNFSSELKPRGENRELYADLLGRFVTLFTERCGGLT